MKGKPVNPRTKGSVWQWKIINILTLRFRFQRRFVKNTLKTLTKLNEKPRVSVLKRNMGGGLLMWKFTKFFNNILFKVLREKCPSTEFFLVRIFLHSDWIRRETLGSEYASAVLCDGRWRKPRVCISCFYHKEIKC